VTETGCTIATWAAETFGAAGSDARVAARANEEMAELIRAATAGLTGDTIVDECADVVIVLARLCFRQNGVDIFDAVDHKMQVNRARRWAKDGTGHGYHVRSKPETS